MMAVKLSRKRDSIPTVTLAPDTSFSGVMRFTQGMCIQGNFSGTVQEGGNLVVEKGALVKADTINVHTLVVHGKVDAEIHSELATDLQSGSEIKGDISTGRIRIADDVLFDGSVEMIRSTNEPDIFSESIDDIKKSLKQQHNSRE
jgi:cytoskeletal protein CcmA (bactofilin family)